MSIKSAVGNITSNVTNDVENIISGATSTIKNIFGSVTTAVSNVFDGGFAGINENGLDELKSAMESYCTTIEGAIEAFNADAQLDAAFKGSVQTAIGSYIKQVKALLQAYVSTMRTQKDFATEAFENWKKAASDIATNIDQDAETIRSQSESIKID